MTTYLTIPAWARQVYLDKPPCVDTVRRWIRRGYIYPQPYSHGRAYRIQSDARYLPPWQQPTVPDGTAASTPTLLERLKNGPK
ncbi:excisionase [Edwardsiella piscicida]